MAKPLRSDLPNPPSVQFKDFGVLNDGSQSKGAFTTSIVTNLVIAALVIIVGSVVKTEVAAPKKADVAFVEPVKEPPPPPPPPPKLPPPPKIEPPKLEPPKIKLPEPDKLPDVKPVPVMAPKAVVLAPAPPKLVNPPPAPVKVNLAAPKAASVVNNDAHPTPIKLGTPDNPLKSLTGPAVSKVNMGNAGAPGMPPGNTGNGPHATKVDMGSGSRYGTDLAGNTGGVRPVKGVALGVPGGTGPLNSKNFSNAPVQPVLQSQARPPAAAAPTVQSVNAGSPPKLLSRDEAHRTDDAKAANVSGAVIVHIRVLSSGSVQVVSVTRGLGHGLDQEALRVAQTMRFQPATDGSGHATNWEGDVKVNFQTAS